MFLGFGFEGSPFIDTSPHGAAFALIIADVMLEKMNWTPEPPAPGPRPPTFKP